MLDNRYNDHMVVNLRVSLILAAVLCFAGNLAQAQRPNPRDLKPVAGIPAPPFGISEQPGAVTHYVNNQHAAATDSDNPNGTPDRPRMKPLRTQTRRCLAGCWQYTTPLSSSSWRRR